MEYKHISVMLGEVIEYLNIQKDQVYVDGTLGGGGYTFGIIQRGGKVLAIDLDQDAIDWVQKAFEGKKLELGLSDDRLLLINGNFANINQIAQEKRITSVAGIVYDLGISSYHIDQSGRGFTFQKDEILDMRMDASASSAQAHSTSLQMDTEKLTAQDIVNKYSEKALYLLFLTKGEEHNAEKIARAIVRNRSTHPIKTTNELVKIISEVVGSHGGINPATKVFQALRIEVNKELENLKKGITDGFSLLSKGGRMVIVDFHSLEDRIVKQEFDRFEKEGKGRILTNKPIRPSLDEMHTNRRSRSAKMRVIEKI